MKKILFFLLLLFCIPFSTFGITGNGSFGSPYSGPLTTDMTWSGTVYVNGDVTVNGFTLTISPDAIIVFLASGADLIITGTGILTASGSAANIIRFTADFNNNGIYGETGERWGHIVFWNMSATAGSSILYYCTIEFGDVSGTSNTTTYGGGIFIRSFSLVTIDHCLISNNKATHGGGIMALKDGSNPVSSPTISNSIISQNTAATSGGGIYLHTGCSSTITNCIINNNTTGTGGGGGIFLDVSSNVRVINSDIVKNTTSNTTRGYNVQYYNISNTTDRPRFINCIVWDADNSIHHVTYNPQKLDFINCAIRDVSTPASVYTNCIDLTSSNELGGPSFVNPNLPGVDWSIKFNSPCQDAGANTYSGVTIPSTDIINNPTINNKDIGAYEVQYSTWSGTTSTDWSTVTNWQSSIAPTSGSSDVIIPTGLTNYPTGSSSQNFTIGSGKLMLLKPGAKVTLGTLTNSGTLKLESDASNISSLIATTFSGNDATIEIYLTGGNPGAPTLKLNKWHFISSPVSSLAVSTFAPTYTKNVVGWYDNQVSGTLATGWIAYNGYRYSSGVIDGPTFDHLSQGFGYDFYAATDQKYTFSGQLNTGTLLMNLDFTTPPGSASLNGFNLLGNPFSSGLDWDYILNNTAFPSSTSKSLYFTRDNAQCSYVGGVGIPSDVTGIIPPMQGFFVKTYSTGNTITIPAGARVQGGIHPRYKGLEVIPLVRLSLAEGTLTDEMVVRFNDAAKSGLDNDFDAPKMFLSSDVLSIYSVSDGSNFAINGLPFPVTSVEIPIVVNLLTAGSNTITATQLQGLDNYGVSLTDNITGIITDLKSTPVVTFTAATGTIADRFVLKIGTITTGIENPVISKNTFNIYPANSIINIQTISDQWDGKSGSVRVLDLTGKVVSDQDNSEFSKNSLIQIAAPEAKGIYMVEVKTGVLRYVGKVVIK
jgi:hypothetical protein